jgi:predicted amidohydrolase YtcJ
MAFGFFKKNETADTIFMGGKIFTQNSDLPWVEAVACKDGLVLAVGDYEDLVEFEGKNTDIVGLEGGFMLPGYIDTCGHPVMKAFQDSCLFLTDGGLEDIIAQISDYTGKREDAEVIFAYGYDEDILKDADEIGRAHV